MKREILNEYLGSYVHITFFDGDIVDGMLTYVPEYSEKYDYKMPGLYYIDRLCFKASCVKKLQAVTIEAGTLRT